MFLDVVERFHKAYNQGCTLDINFVFLLKPSLGSSRILSPFVRKEGVRDDSTERQGCTFHVTVVCLFLS